MPKLKRDATSPPAPDHASDLPPLTELDGLVARLTDVLNKAQVETPVPLSLTLRKDQVRADMHAVLVQLGPARTLPLLHSLATADLPDRREALDALLTGDMPGSAQTLRATLQAAHQQNLLAAIFHPDRLHGLRQACRSLTKEPT